mmetsp:Transcript_99065/g.280585  ORF Transcript_99065/g.280585 Transcript_99065/m.280585 type:complete len:216 (-) Transcript_99065:373-1020(-)
MVIQPRLQERVSCGLFRQAHGRHVEDSQVRARFAAGHRQAGASEGLRRGAARDEVLPALEVTGVVVPLDLLPIVRLHLGNKLRGVVLQHLRRRRARVAGAACSRLRMDPAEELGADLEAEPGHEPRPPGRPVLDLQQLVAHRLVLAAVQGLRAPVAVAPIDHGAPHEVAEALLDEVVRAACVGVLRDPCKPGGQHPCERIPDQLDLGQLLICIER